MDNDEVLRAEKQITDALFPEISERHYRLKISSIKDSDDGVVLEIVRSWKDVDRHGDKEFVNLHHSLKLLKTSGLFTSLPGNITAFLHQWCEFKKISRR